MDERLLYCGPGNIIQAATHLLSVTSRGLNQKKRGILISSDLTLKYLAKSRSMGIVSHSEPWNENVLHHVQSSTKPSSDVISAGEVRVDSVGVSSCHCIIANLT